MLRNLLAPWREYPIATLTTAVVFAVGGAILAVATTTSDEPPIRVKNGSMDFELLTAGDGWQAVGGSPNWKAPGKRSADGLHVDVAGMNCSFSQSGVTSLELVYHDDAAGDREFDLKSVSRHTMLMPRKDTVKQTGAITLSYQHPGYLRSVGMNGQKPVCSFDSAEQLSYFLIY